MSYSWPSGFATTARWVIGGRSWWTVADVKVRRNCMATSRTCTSLRSSRSLQRGEVTEKLAEAEVCGIGWNWNQVRHVHLFGGGYINGRWPNSVSLLGAAAQLRQKYGIPCLATGLGVAPLSGLDEADAKALAEVIRSFSLFELRDLQSYNDVAELVGFRSTIVCGLDDCFLYPVGDLTRPRQKPGRALHLSGFEKSFASLT